MPDILKLADTLKWVGILIIDELLEDKALEEGEEYEYIPIEELVAKGSVQFSSPRKGEEPVAPLLAEHLKSLQTDLFCTV